MQKNWQQIECDSLNICKRPGGRKQMDAGSKILREAAKGKTGIQFDQMHPWQAAWVSISGSQ